MESIGVDDSRHRLYVNIRDKQEVGVIDLTSKRMIDTWKAPGLNGNTALILNPNDQQVFVAGRKPGIFYVFDMHGKVVAQEPCVETNDDMMWDPALKRVYISGSQGLSIFQQETPTRFREITRLPTNGGKTSIIVPQLHRFFVIHPKTEIDVAALLMYQVNP